VDALERHDLEQSLATPPAIKLARALETMQLGLMPKRANLLRKHPSATEQEIDAEFLAWLSSDD